MREGEDETGSAFNSESRLTRSDTRSGTMVFMFEASGVCF